MFSTGSLTLQDSTVSHSQAAATGGGLAIRSGTLNAARDAIVDNSAGPDQGPGGGDHGRRWNILLLDDRQHDRE